MHGKLGKLEPRHDPRTLKLARYIDEATFAGAAIPSKVLDTPVISDWPMFANDQVGDCVEAAMGHVEELTGALGDGGEPRIIDADVLKVYEDVAGYNPHDPSTDNGTVMLDALNYWRHTGIAGHKIVGFAAFDHHNTAEWKAAIYLFGAAFLGLALPITAQAQSGPGEEWHAPHSKTGDGAPGSWGGHCVPAFDYSRSEVDVITWGFRQRATWPFVEAYADEAYVVFDAGWVSAVSGKDPHGFDSTKLLADLAQFS